MCINHGPAPENVLFVYLNGRAPDKRWVHLGKLDATPSFANAKTAYIQVSMTIADRTS